MKAESILTKHFCDKNNINSTQDFNVEFVDAKQFLVPERIDLIAKIKYIEAKEKGENLDFTKEVYAAHLEAISLGTYQEPGNKEKNSLEAYIRVFDQLIENIKKEGFIADISVVPVGERNIILDGAHRVAIAIYYNLKIPIIRLKGLEANYNAIYFRKRLLSEQYLNFLVQEYCSFKDNIYFACVWPKATEPQKLQEVNNVLNKNLVIVDTKEVHMNFEGLAILMTQIYSTQKWIGNVENQFVGARNKAIACYKENQPIKIYILESNSFQRILDVKAEIREIFCIGNHSVHITDNQSETIQMARLLLNQNSLDFMNNARPHHYIEFNRKIEKFKNLILTNNYLVNNFIIGSSSILALYGLRKANDIDYITLSEDNILNDSNEFGNHLAYLKFYNSSKDSLILDPTKHFVYNDLKFTTLEQLKIFKSNRKEEKDFIDLKLIESIEKDSTNLSLFHLRLMNWTKKKQRNIQYYSKVIIARILINLKIYNLLRKFKNSLKRD